MIRGVYANKNKARLAKTSHIARIESEQEVETTMCLAQVKNLKGAKHINHSARNHKRNKTHILIQLKVKQ